MHEVRSEDERDEEKTYLQTKPHHARREVWERKKSHAVIPGALGLERSRVRQAEEAAAALEAPLVACEKESEVRSENDSEEEETYLPRKRAGKGTRGQNRSSAGRTTQQAPRCATFCSG